MTHQSNFRGSGLLKLIDDFDNFAAIRDVAPELISNGLVSAVRELDEREELEPYLRLILHDPNDTPHGPAEISDIFTHKLTIQRLTGLAAFVLKGRSFKTVRAQDVAHQFYRLEKVADLAIAIFAAPGVILDPAKEMFVSTAVRLGCNYAIFDAVDVEYQGLLPFEESDVLPDHRHARTRKEVLNLPLGCEVRFDEKVLKVFADQSLDPRYATRHNIGRILLYEYEKLERHLAHVPSRREVDRFSVLDSSFYIRVFGSWENFEVIVRAAGGR